MSKHSIKHTLALVLGLAVPVMALTGCPLPGFGGTTPSPTPTVAATPARATGVVITKVSVPTTATNDRAITLKNLGTAEVDTSKFVVSYEYAKADGSIATQQLRIAGSKKITGGGTLLLTDNGSDFVKDTAIDPNSTTLGIQLGGGALSVFKDITATADIKSANFADYMQYGSAKSYKYGADAVTAKVWDSKDNYATAPSSVGKALTVKVEGNIGSTNWEVK